MRRSQTTIDSLATQNATLQRQMAVFERISAEKELILRRFSKYNVPMRQTIGGGAQIDTEALGGKMGYSGRQIEKIMEMGLRHASLA